ncbi:MAG: hypothetical protein AAB923_03180, partial [Patescibacteria group bacterium]
GQRAYDKKKGKLLFKSKYETNPDGTVKVGVDGKPIVAKERGVDLWDESPYEFAQRMEQDRSGLRHIRDESSGVFADLDPTMIQYWYDEDPESLARLGKAWSTAQMKAIVENKEYAKGIRNKMVDSRGRVLKDLADEAKARLKIASNREYFKDANGNVQSRWKNTWVNPDKPITKDRNGTPLPNDTPDIEQFSPEHNALRTKIYFQTRNVYSAEDLKEFGVLWEDLPTNEAYVDAMLSSKLKDLQDDPRISVAIKRKMRNIRRYRYRSGYNMADYGVLGLSNETGVGDGEDDYEANTRLAGLVDKDQRSRSEASARATLARTQDGAEAWAATMVLDSLGKLKDGERRAKNLTDDQRRQARDYLREQVRTGDERVRRYMAGKTGEEIYREVRQEDLGNQWIAKNITVHQRAAQGDRDQNWLTTLDKNINLVGRETARTWMRNNFDGQTATGGMSAAQIREAEEFREKTGYAPAEEVTSETGRTRAQSGLQQIIIRVVREGPKPGEGTRREAIKTAHGDSTVEGMAGLPEDVLMSPDLASELEADEVRAILLGLAKRPKKWRAQIVKAIKDNNSKPAVQALIREYEQTGSVK